jgi:MFS family permease
LFFFLPLGDKVDRRHPILILFTLNVLCLAATALAPTFAMLSLASLAIGITAVTAQVIIPAVSGLAAPAERGRVVGTLVSGPSAGLLLARASCSRASRYRMRFRIGRAEGHCGGDASGAAGPKTAFEGQSSLRGG